jgi:ketosteroid isomerase-like protein
MQRDVEKIQELYQAFAKRDARTVLMLMSEEVEIVQSRELPWGGEYRGHEGARDFLGKLTEHLDTRLEIERFIDAGEHVVAIGRTVGQTRAAKLEFDVPVAHVWTLREGRITRFEPYIDNATMLAALGR